MWHRMTFGVAKEHRPEGQVTASIYVQKHLSFAVSLFLLLVITANTSFAQSAGNKVFNANYLAHFEGKEIWTKIDGQSLDKNKDFIIMLKKTFPGVAIKHLLSGWGPAGFEQPTMVSGPIKRDGNLMSIFVCKPHACSDDFVEVYIDLETMTAQGMVSTNDKAVWYVPEKKSFPVKGYGGCGGDLKCARKIMASIKNSR